METKQENIDPIDYYTLLLGLGVPAALLATEQVDYKQLYTHLNSEHRFLCT